MGDKGEETSPKRGRDQDGGRREARKILNLPRGTDIVSVGLCDF